MTKQTTQNKQADRKRGRTDAPGADADTKMQTPEEVAAAETAAAEAKAEAAAAKKAGDQAELEAAAAKGGAGGGAGGEPPAPAGAAERAPGYDALVAAMTAADPLASKEYIEELVAGMGGYDVSFEAILAESQKGHFVGYEMLVSEEGTLADPKRSISDFGANADVMATSLAVTDGYAYQLPAYHVNTGQEEEFAAAFEKAQAAITARLDKGETEKEIGAMPFSQVIGQELAGQLAAMVTRKDEFAEATPEQISTGRATTSSKATERQYAATRIRAFLGLSVNDPSQICDLMTTRVNPCVKEGEEPVKVEARTSFLTPRYAGETSLSPKGTITAASKEAKKVLKGLVPQVTGRTPKAGGWAAIGEQIPAQPIALFAREVSSRKIPEGKKVLLLYPYSDRAPGPAICAIMGGALEFFAGGYGYFRVPHAEIVGIYGEWKPGAKHQVSKTVMTGFKRGGTFDKYVTKGETKGCGRQAFFNRARHKLKMFTDLHPKTDFRYLKKGKSLQRKVAVDVDDNSDGEPAAESDDDEA